MSNLQDQVTQEQDQFITLAQPYNGVDDLFFSLFRVFPLAQVPKEPEALIEFKSKLEDLLNFAEMQEVDVILQDRNEYQSYIIKNLSDFDYGLEFTKAIKDPVTPDLPDVGNFWSIASEPFTVNFNDVYDNILDPIDHRYTAIGNLEPKGQIELPKSNFDSAHHLGSELRIVDRLSKYGESFPFLNENGLLSDAAKADFEQLLMSEATDEELLQFLDKGIDFLKRASDATGISRVAAGVRDGVRDAAGKVAEKTKDLAKASVDKVYDKVKEKGREKAKEKEKDEELRKRDIKELLDKAQDQLDELNAKKIAQDKIKGKTKEDSKAIAAKSAADSSANNAIRTAIEHDDRAGANKLSKEQESVNAEVKDQMKALKDKEASKKLPNKESK